MTRSLVVVLAAGALSAGMIVAPGVGVAAADSPARNRHHHRPVVTQVDPGKGASVDADEELLPQHMTHYRDDPNYRKHLFDLLRHSISN